MRFRYRGSRILLRLRLFWQENQQGCTLIGSAPVRYFPAVARLYVGDVRKDSHDHVTSAPNASLPDVTSRSLRVALHGQTSHPPSSDPCFWREQETPVAANLKHGRMAYPAPSTNW